MDFVPEYGLDPLLAPPCLHADLLDASNPAETPNDIDFMISHEF
jgi:hypothetical protein